MRGTRDEGILIILAYRASQEKGTSAGPFTAYSQQIDNMLREGDITLDLSPGSSLISKHR